MKWIKNGVRFGVFLGAITGAHAATTLIGVETTSTQAILRIRTDQTGTCVVKVSAVNNFGVGYAPINDVNTTYFSGSDQCSRAGNISSGNRWTLVIGKRVAELASDGKMKYSRALQTVSRYYYSIALGSDSLTGEFTTGNIQTGNTHNDSRFDRSRPGEYAYPSMNWVDDSVEYVDPSSGVALRRMPGVGGKLYPTVQASRPFSSTVGGSGWSGLTWTGTGAGSNLYMRETDPAGLGRFWSIQSIDAVRLVVTLSGSAPGVSVCLTNDGVNCAGASITQAITGTPTSYTIGTTTPILDSWRSGTTIPSTYVDVQPMVSSVTKSGTTITWTGGDPFNLNWGPGSLLTLGSTDCAIASVTNQKTIVLASAGCIANGNYTSTGRNFGFLLRSTGTGTVTVAASPTWTSYISGTNLSGDSGIAEICSPVHISSPAGQLCSVNGSGSASSSGPAIYFIPDDGGPPRLIANTYGNPTATTLLGAGCPAAVWDETIPAKWWCLNNFTEKILYSVTYIGDYSSAVVGDNYASLATATTTVESTDITALVNAFTASDPIKYSDFTSTSGWGLRAIQNGKLLLQSTMNGQDTPAWIAVYDPATHDIVAAISTYGGAAGAINRWGALHTLNIGGSTSFSFSTINQLRFPTYGSGVSSGTLTSSFSTCPSNTVDPSLTGQSLCSAITLSSITPTSSGVSLFGQRFQLGDGAYVLSNGDIDNEVVRILTISGTTINVQRNYRPYVFDTTTRTNHGGTLSLNAFPGSWKEFWWDFVSDPHGQSISTSYGNTVMEDPHSSNCHEVYQNEVFLVGCVKDQFIAGTVVRNGALPNPSFTNSRYTFDQDAPFAGSTFRCSSTTCESHPSIGQRTATAYEKPIISDNRPYAGDNSNTSGNVTNVTGDLYKLSATGTANFDYRLQGLVGTAGEKVLAEVSPAVLAGTSGDAFKSCYVVIAGDCRSGSNVGEYYFNIPKLVSMDTISSRFVDPPNNGWRDFAITGNTVTLNDNYQVRAIGYTDRYGTALRRMTTLFAPLKLQIAYWNSQAVPDNSRAFGSSYAVENARNETMLWKLPPWPAPQSTNRGTFVPVALSMSGVSGDTIRVRFGYAENGAATALYCHERQVACATDASGALPYVWTDETQRWATCNTRCTVNVPAISGRVLYYVVDRKNGSTTVSGGLEAVTVP